MNAATKATSYATVPAEGPHWTIAVRRRNGHRFVRVNTIHLTRAQAGDLATFVEATKPREQAVVVPTWHAEQDGLVADDERGVYVTARGTRLSTGGPAGLPLASALSHLRTVGWRAPREVEPEMTEELGLPVEAVEPSDAEQEEPTHGQTFDATGTLVSPYREPAARRAARQADMARPDRYVVIGVDRTTGEPSVLGRFEGDDAADRAHRLADREGDVLTATQVVGLR